MSVGPDNTLYVAVGLGGPPSARDDLTSAGAPGSDFASIWTAGTDGSNLTKLADLGDFEAKNNPDDGTVPDSVADTNPYSVLAPDTVGGPVYAVDAGGNDLLRIDSGTVSTVAVFPPVMMAAPPFLQAPPGTHLPAQPVPTSVVAAPGGGFTVGQLTGFPFQVGAASVFNVSSGKPSPYASGFTNVIDTAWGPDGNLYVLEISHNGLLGDSSNGGLWRVSDGGATRELLMDDLFMPGGIAFGPDGMAYVSNCSVCTGQGPSPAQTGHVLRVDAVASPALVTLADDDATTTEDTPVSVDVLANDTAGGDLGVARVVDSGAASATVSDGKVEVQPAAHQQGTDHVTYWACTAGEHCAAASLTVTITPTATDRVAGNDRISTAIRTSRAAQPGGSASVLVARADAYADALTASVLAAALDPPGGAPILLTPTGSLDARTAAEINRLGATTAYVLGGEAAISGATVQAIVDQTSVTSTVRISGSNRFETAAAIKAKVAEVTGQPVTGVYIAQGADPDPRRGFPDVLSVAALAAHQGLPILLVTTDTLPSATRSALQGINGATIIGGTKAVSADVQSQIDDVVNKVDRVAGADRYETSVKVVQIATAAGLDANKLWLATGENWPDAVTAGPSVAVDGGVLLLVNPDDLAASVPSRDFIQQQKPFDDIDLLGGIAAISAHVEQQVAAAAGG